MVERRNIHKSWEPLLRRHAAETVPEEHREAVRESVAEHIEEAKRQHATTPAMADDVSVVATTDEHAKKLSTLGEPDQVAFLGKIAMEQGVVKAVAIAEKSGSPYVIDALHDLLVDELQVEMRARRK